MSGPRRYYTLASLLDAQPKGLVKDSRHRLLWDSFMSSEKLQKLRISRRCYNLLNKARIKPENLKSFYRTYRLPGDSFFPLFLAVKNQWIEDRLKWQEDRQEAIRNIFGELPEHRLQTLKMLAWLEQSHHPSAGNPLWDSTISPNSKKRAAELIMFSENDWQKLFSLFIGRLSDRYRSFREPAALRAEAMLMLGFNLQTAGTGPEKTVVNDRFRILSKTYHPDKGGNAVLFRRLKTARDVLLVQAGDR